MHSNPSTAHVANANTDLHSLNCVSVHYVQLPAFVIVRLHDPACEHMDTQVPSSILACGV